MDTVEDNAEFRGQLLQSQLYLNYKKSPKNKIVKPTQCPFCSSSFPISELDKHLLQEHKGQYFYLRINGSIVREEFSIEWIECLEIVLRGFKNVDIEILGSDFHEKFKISETQDLSDYFPKQYEGKIEIRIQLESNKLKRYTIFNKSIPEYTNDELDNSILKWQKDLESSSKNKHSLQNIQLWKSQFEEISNITYLDKRYFNGFFEYVIGSNLERNRKYKKAKERFEMAFGLLLPFRTSLSKTTVRLLGLKMNCFKVFENCSVKSFFARADAMFNKFQVTEQNQFQVQKTSENGIFVDDFSLLLLDTLDCFYNYNKNRLPNLLDLLKRNPLANEKNNNDKLRFLTAQYFCYIGGIEKAKELFIQLENHPNFGKQARNILNNK